MSSLQQKYSGRAAEEQIDKYFKAVGQALSAWMQAEGWLSSLYTQSFDSDNYIGHRYVFASIRSVDAKLKAIDASLGSSDISNFTREDEVRKLWKSFRTKIAAANVFRNKLAHGKVDLRNSFVYFNPFPWGNDIPSIEQHLAHKERGEEFVHTVPPSHAIALEEIEEYSEGIARLYAEFEAVGVLFHARRAFARK